MAAGGFFKPAQRPAMLALQMLALAGAYFIAGRAALLLAIPPGYATAVWPAAGVALAGVLLCGRRVSPGVWLGSFLVNVWTSLDPTSYSSVVHSTALAGGIALGATLQAMLGAACIRRYVGFPNLFTRDEDVVKLLAIGGPLSCLVASSIGIATLVIAGAIQPDACPFSWFTWWVGDTIGVLIFLPLMLMAFAEPREAWRPRRMTVGLPLCIAFAVAVAVFIIASSLERNRARADFERRADTLAGTLREHIADHIDDLRAVESFFASSDSVTRNEFHTFVEGVLQHHPGLTGLSWNPRVPKSEREAFVQRIVDEHLPELNPPPKDGVKMPAPVVSVFEKTPNRIRVPVPDREEYFPVDYVEPRSRIPEVLGFDSAATEDRRSIQERARDTGLPVATGRVIPISDARASQLYSIVVYLPLYRLGVPHDTVAQRRANLTGFLAAGFRVGDFVDSTVRFLERDGIDIQLTDESADPAERWLFGPSDSDNAAGMQFVQRFDVAGRKWKFRATRSAGYLVAHRSVQSWMVLAGGLLFTSLLGGFLLVLTGHSARVGTLVDERTAALSLANADLTQRRAFMRAVLENVEDGIIACDADGNVTFINQTVRRFHDLVGEPPAGWVPSSQLFQADGVTPMPDEQVPLFRALRGEEVRDVHLVVRATKNAEPRSLRVSGHAFFDADGKKLGAVVVLHDVTDQLRTDQQLRLAKATAEDASRAKTEFLANMSHEIRTPMTSILGYADLMSRSPAVPADLRDHVQAIRRNGEHLLTVLNDILDISKIEAGKMVVELIDFSPAQLLAEVDSLMRVRALEKGLDLTVVPEGELPEWVQSDPTRIRQILMNLIGNAIKFTERGSVTISLSAVGENRLRFDVTDTGIGLTPEQAAGLFQPFAQANASVARRFGGTGLGLAICRRLTEMLGGQLTLQSQLGAGSTFSFTVQTGATTTPVAPLTADAFSVGSPLAAGDMQVAARVLLADDSPDNQKLVTLYLAGVGLSVDCAPNGLVALQKVQAASAKGEPYDVVLMDMQMPEMDGYTATRELRRLGFKNLPIIAFTAHAMGHERDLCIEAGCDDYAVKPINPGALIATIYRNLHRAAPVCVQASAQAPVVIAPARVLRSTQSNDPIMSQVLPEYIVNLSTYVGELTRLVGARDLPRIKRIVHQLRGSGGSYGFDEITRLARIAEHAITDGADEQAILVQIRELITLIRTVEGYDPAGEIAAAAISSF